MSTTAEQETVYIDGGFGEGGGQIIRTSVSLAALTGRTVEISQIRARRSKPGLQAQHLTSVRAAGAICNATLQGDRLESQYLRFVPGTFAQGSACTFRFDVAEARGGASAGATCLVAQTLLVPLLLLAHESGAVDVSILGGTHVPMSPAADYLEAVYTPLLRRMGMEIACSYSRAGFYPRGGGALALKGVGARPTHPIDCVDRGRLLALRVFLVTSQLPEHVAERGRETVLKDLKGYGVPVTIEKRDMQGNGAGAAVVIVAECENGMGGWTSLGERGKPMERVALEALRGFQKWYATGAGVEEHLADQLALPCALYPGESRWTTPEVTDHLRTVLWTIQQFLPIEYAVEERPDGTGLVSIRGVDLFDRHPPYTSGQR